MFNGYAIIYTYILIIYHIESYIIQILLKEIVKTLILSRVFINIKGNDFLSQEKKLYNRKNLETQGKKSVLIRNIIVLKRNKIYCKWKKYEYNVDKSKKISII